MPPRFFITHSWSDIEFATRFTDDLRARGLDGFFDAYSLRPGDLVSAEIQRGLEQCDVYVPILSYAALRSPWCEEEINAAINLSKLPGRNGRPRIIPILVEDCRDQMGKYNFLLARRYVLFENRYNTAFQDFWRGVMAAPTQEPPIVSEQRGGMPERPRFGRRIPQDHVSRPDLVAIAGLIIAAIACIGTWLALSPFPSLLFPTPTSSIRLPAPSPTIPLIQPSAIAFTSSPSRPSVPSPTIPFAQSPSPSPSLLASESSGQSPPPVQNPTQPQIVVQSSIRREAICDRIAFASTRGPGSDIYTIKSDGSDLKRLTETVEDEAYPAWSPDGKRIAYSSKSGSPYFQIWTMNADGSNPQRLRIRPKIS